MVTQDTSLLHRSIRENIRYGRRSATDAQIIEAARRPKRTISSSAWRTGTAAAAMTPMSASAA